MAGSDLEIAERFLKHRIGGHCKDVAICLRGYRLPRLGRLTHAYFPALMITIGFADLLSGLRIGRTDGQGRDDLQDYFDNFMDRQKYPRDALNVLYEGFRHKIAHLGHPYFIFDTATRKHAVERATQKLVFQPPYLRYGWTVYSANFPRFLSLNFRREAVRQSQHTLLQVLGYKAKPREPHTVKFRHRPSLFRLLKN